MINWKKIIAPICLALMAAAAMAQNTNWYVAPPPAGRDDGTHAGTAWTNAFASISNALVLPAVVDGHVIHVSNGHYVLTAQINVTKGVTIRGVNTPGQTNTVLNGDGSNRCFRIQHANAVVEGLLITNGAPPAGMLSGYGGGVYMDAGTLRACLIAGNTGVRGGGVWADGNSVISNCAVTGNMATGASDGGGGVCLVGAARLIGGYVSDNAAPDSATAYGSGVLLRAVNGALVAGCAIERNIGGRGGLALYGGPHGVVSNCAIAWHTNVAGGVNAVSETLWICNTTIASNSVRGVTVAGGGAVVLDDCRIEYNGGGLGAGVSVTGWAVITNCDVRHNQSPATAGALSFHFSGTGSGSGTVTHSRVTGNLLDGGGTEVYGGGVRVGLNRYGVVLDTCEIRGNVLTNATRGYGGGISLSSNCVVRNCLVADNWCEGSDGTRGGLGGGIYVATNAANLIESATIAGNYARLTGAGVHLAGAGADRILNTIVYGNQNQGGADNWFFGDANRQTNVTYSCSPEVLPPPGNITGAPLFLDPVAGDYRLGAGSPCVNAGLNQNWMALPGALDLDAHPRLDRFSKRVDIGCYEYLTQGTLYNVR